MAKLDPRMLYDDNKLTNLCVDAMWSKEYLRIQTITMKNLSPIEREQVDKIIGKSQTC